MNVEMDLLLGRRNARNNVCDERKRGVWYIALLWFAAGVG